MDVVNQPIELDEEDLDLVSGGFSLSDLVGNFVHIVQFSNNPDNASQSVSVTQSN